MRTYNWTMMSIFSVIGQIYLYGSISLLEGINRTVYYHRGFSVEWPLVWVSIFGFSYCGNQRALQASSICCCYLVPLLYEMDSLLPCSHQLQYRWKDLLIYTEIIILVCYVLCVCRGFDRNLGLGCHSLL